MGGANPFAIGTFADLSGEPFAGIVVDGCVARLDHQLGSEVTVRRLLDGWDESFNRLQRFADRGKTADQTWARLDELRPLPPIMPPGQIFQAGANYREHVLDLMTAAANRDDQSDGLMRGDRDRARDELENRLRDGRPFVFLGSAHAMVGALDEIVLPHDSNQHDWELELAAVIGRNARRVRGEAALDTIAGYTICNDITTRDALFRADARSLGLDWLAAKNAPSFLPTGPLLVPAAHFPHPMDVQIMLSVNGRVMQDGSTADMVFDIAALIEYISNVSELRPGDIVLTGSPAGNGAARGVFLCPGDVIEGSITGLGMQRNRCVAEQHVRNEETAAAADCAATD